MVSLHKTSDFPLLDIVNENCFPRVMAKNNVLRHHYIDENTSNLNEKFQLSENV